MGWLIALITVGVLANLAVLFLIHMSGNLPWGARGTRRKRLTAAVRLYRSCSGNTSTTSAAEEAAAWSTVRVPFARKEALILAGIPVTDARAKHVRQLSLDELHTLAALAGTTWSSRRF